MLAPWLAPRPCALRRRLGFTVGQPSAALPSSAEVFAFYLALVRLGHATLCVDLWEAQLVAARRLAVGRGRAVVRVHVWQVLWRVLGEGDAPQLTHALAELLDARRGQKIDRKEAAAAASTVIRVPTARESRAGRLLLDASAAAALAAHAATALATHAAAALATSAS